MFCPNCGNNCNDTDVVCGNCGTPLNPAANPAPGYAAAPAYGAAPAAPKAKAADKVKNVGKAITGNKTVLYAIIGVAALLVIILLASLIFSNPAGNVGLKYVKAQLAGNYEKANKLSAYKYKDYIEDYESYVKKDLNVKKFDLKEAYTNMKEDHIDDLEDEYGKNYKVKNVKLLYVHEWDKDDVEDWIDENEDSKAFGDKDSEDYLDFSKVKKIATVYVSYVIEGKKDGDAGVATVTMAKVGGSWKVLRKPYINFDPDDFD